VDEKHRWNIGYWLVALLLLLLQDIWRGASEAQAVSYSQFEQALADGRIASLTISDLLLPGRLKTPEGNKTVLVATRVEPELAARLQKFDVPYTRVVERKPLRDLLSWILPALVFFGLWFFLFRNFVDKQGMGDFLSIGKSRATSSGRSWTFSSTRRSMGDWAPTSPRACCWSG